MKSKKLIISSILMVIILVLPTQVFASPAYRSNVHQLFEDVDSFFEETSILHWYPSAYFMPKDYIGATAFSGNPYLDDIYNPGDLIIDWYITSDNFASPAIVFDEKGFKALRFDLENPEDGFPEIASNFLKEIFGDIIQDEQITKIVESHNDFKSNNTVASQYDIELANSELANLYFCDYTEFHRDFYINLFGSFYNDIYNESFENLYSRYTIYISLKERNDSIYDLNGLEYYSLICNINKMFNDDDYFYLTEQEIDNKFSYVFAWNSDDVKPAAVYTIPDSIANEGLGIIYEEIIVNQDSAAVKLKDFYIDIAPNYFSGYNLLTIDFLINQSLNQQISFGGSEKEVYIFAIQPLEIEVVNDTPTLNFNLDQLNLELYLDYYYIFTFFIHIP